MSSERDNLLIPEAIRKLSKAMEKLHYDTFIKKRFNDEAEVMTLSLRQVTAMRSVKELTINNKEGVTLKELAEYIKATVPAASLLVDGMVKKSLFIRKENPIDRRSILIKLSKKGENHFERTRSALEKAFLKLSESFTDEERDLLVQSADMLYTKIHQYEEQDD